MCLPSQSTVFPGECLSVQSLQGCRHVLHPRCHAVLSVFILTTVEGVYHTAVSFCIFLMTKEVGLSACLCTMDVSQTSLDLGFRRAEYSFLFIPSGPKDGTGVVY